ncbi:transglutaminase-like domain-containing protein [Rhodospirillaceae bacterium SYSU D60014]|uniref:SirB1 family protein n=1 Tax=Virgifigura deserti TaxID=2268457 RepID=UPI000E671C79
MTNGIEAEDILRRVAALPDEAIDLAEAALALASFDRPEVGLNPYREHLSQLARDVAAFAKDGEAADAALEPQVEALGTILADRYGYAGDSVTYDDLQNANLMQVIDRRRGLPVALGILYIHAARAQNWEIHGLSFPGHFLIRLQRGGEQAILDPFNGGRVREAADLRGLLKATAGIAAELTPGHYAPVGNREILLRLQNNIKLRLIQDRQFERAVAVVERMLLFAPGQASLLREAGIIHAQLGNLRAATAALESFLNMSDIGGDQRHEAARLLQSLKGQLN